MTDKVVTDHRLYDHHAPDMEVDAVHETWSALRRCPIGRSDAYGGIWVVTGYAEADEIFHRAEEFSSSPLIIPPFPQALKMVPVEVDPPDHFRYRTLVAAPFSPRHAERQEGPLRAAVNRLIDGFIELGRCDIYKMLAEPFPVRMSTIMLGTPDEDATKFDDWTHKIIHESASNFEVAGEAVIDVYAYFYALLEERRANPIDDVMSLLAQAEVDGVKLTDEELMGFCLLLLIASIDTSQKTIGGMLYQLATETDIRDRLVANPDSIPLAVEEFLRLWAPIVPARRCTADAVVSGVEMKEGDQILIITGAANRDEREFPGAEQFVDERQPNRHLAFGTHIHRCLGSHFARIEIRVLLEELLRRIPDFELEPGGDVEWASGQVQGVVKVPIRFTPGPREISEQLQTTTTA